jgi:hypothetical protein
MLKPENVELKVPISIGNGMRDNCTSDGMKEGNKHLLSALFTFHSSDLPKK